MEPHYKQLNLNINLPWAVLESKRMHFYSPASEEFKRSATNEIKKTAPSQPPALKEKPKALT